VNLAKIEATWFLVVYVLDVQLRRILHLDQVLERLSSSLVSIVVANCGVTNQASN
jgi:hypothetical protein